MKRTILTFVAAAVSLLFLGAAPAFAQRLRAGVSFEYGTASSSFGLEAYGAPGGLSYFSIPNQNNTSTDGVISADLEYIFARRRPLEVGFELKGSFGISGWNLGTPAGSLTTDGFPGVYDTYGAYVTPGTYAAPDSVHISADWWALAAMVTGHLHLGPFVTLNGAVGYGPYSYFNVNYWDDLGLVSGPVSQSFGLFPSRAWSVDWSAGLGFGFFGLFSVDLDVGMMGPDFLTGLGVDFLI
jgi:hypothetical protein